MTPPMAAPSIATVGFSSGSSFSAAITSTAASHTSLASFGGGSAVASSSGGSHGGSGGASSSGSSHGSSAGGTASPHSSSSSSASGRSSSASTTSSSARSKAPASAKSGQKTPVPAPSAAEKSDRKPDKKGFFSFLRHRKPAPQPEAAIIPVGCKFGQKCTLSCQSGKAWNGFGCGLPSQYLQYQPYGRFNVCTAIAEQLRGLRAKMNSDSRLDAGDSLLYRSLLSQYEACLHRWPLGSLGLYTFEPSLFANPLFDMP